jgi:hypothetical protein
MTVLFYKENKYYIFSKSLCGCMKIKYKNCHMRRVIKPGRLVQSVKKLHVLSIPLNILSTRGGPLQ